MPKEEDKVKKKVEEIKQPISEAIEESFDDNELGPQVPTSINEDLKDLIDDNPNKLIGCGG